MAGLRSLGGGFGGVGAALRDWAMADMEDRRIRERQQELSAQGMRQHEIEALGPMLQKGDITMDDVPQEYKPLLSPFAAAAPTQDERISSVVGKWGAAKDPGQVPNQDEAIQALIGARVNTKPELNLTRNVPVGDPNSTDGTIPATQKPFELPQPVMQALSTRAGISDRLTKQQDATNVTGMDFMSKEGVHQHMVVPTSQAASYGSLPQERTGAQEGQRVLDTARAGTLSPGYAVSEAESKNQINRLTLPDDLNRAGRLASTTESAQQHAYMAPDLVQGRVAEANAKVKGAYENGAPTDTELTKAQFIAPMIAADGKAREIEKRGAGFRNGLLQTVQSPMLSSLDSMMEHFTPDEREYAQAAIDYSNNFAQLKSGVTVREDEFPRYLYNLFAIDSDSPEVRKQKAATRAAFNASVQISLGRGKYEGGLAIGRAIRQGTITPAALGVMSLDPEVLKGINDIGSGVKK